MKKNSTTPGRSLLNECKRSLLMNAICDRLHIKQIAHDYHQMWHQSNSDAERSKIEQEYRLQIGLALLLPFGVTIGTALVLSMFTPTTLATLFVVTIACIYRLLR